MLNGKVTILCWIDRWINKNGWIDKKDTGYMSEYFPQPNFLGAIVKFELDLSNYATKTDLKNTTEVDTS